MHHVFFTADLHLFDEDIAKARGFRDAQEYREVMSSCWNITVDDDDIVYILGDISKEHQPSAVQFIHNKLNGHKILIPGNHDTFDTCQLFQMDPKCLVKMPGEEIKLRDNKILLTHYPVHSDEMDFHDYNIHGHIHSPIPEIGYKPRMYPNPRRDVMCRKMQHVYFNVNIEFHKWTPVSSGQILNWIYNE